MKLIDLHTHHTGNDIFILNCGTEIPAEAQYVSIGIHPWEIDKEWQQQIEKIASLASDKRVRAIGECGIDTVKSSAPIEVQTEVLQKHIEISEKCKKPLILHIVKGQETIMRLRNRLHPTQRWIIHGFRGKQQQALQYTSAGIYLCFGEQFNSEALRAIPREKLLIETDESNISLAELYKKIADTLGITKDELAKTIKENSERCGIL